MRESSRRLYICTSDVSDHRSYHIALHFASHQLTHAIGQSGEEISSSDEPSPTKSRIRNALKKTKTKMKALKRAIYIRVSGLKIEPAIQALADEALAWIKLPAFQREVVYPTNDRYFRDFLWETCRWDVDKFKAAWGTRGLLRRIAKGDKFGVGGGNVDPKKE